MGNEIKRLRYNSNNGGYMNKYFAYSAALSEMLLDKLLRGLKNGRSLGSIT